jgi:hypothetical protein
MRHAELVLALIGLSTSCAFATAAPAQGSPCLSDSAVNSELVSSVRAMLKSSVSDPAMKGKADSAYVTRPDSVCAVAVAAYHAIPGGTRTALYVVVVPGLNYIVMPETPDGKLITLTWFSDTWSDPLAMEP